MSRRKRHRSGLRGPTSSAVTTPQGATPAIVPAPPEEPPPPVPVRDIEEDRAQIAIVRERWMRAVASADIDGLLALITDDAVFLPNHAPAATGKDTIRAMYAALFAQSRVEQRWESEEQVIAGDWAFDRGLEWFTITPRDGNAPAREVGPQRGIVILHRDAAGDWRYARSISNTGNPMPPPPPVRTPTPARAFRGF